MKLPDPRLKGGMSLEEAIYRRRTKRKFSDQPLAIAPFAQLLWSAQGVTGADKFKRSAPSAGALYPMDLYAAVGEAAVETLIAGLYHYHPRDHGISLLKHGDLRKTLAKASLHQMWMATAPAMLIITAEYQRITGKYGRRGIRYAMIEAGHIGQNILLQAVSLGLVAGIVGAYQDQKIQSLLGLKDSHEPLLIIPVGFRRGAA